MIARTIPRRRRRLISSWSTAVSVLLSSSRIEPTPQVSGHMPAPLRRQRRRWSVPMPLRHLEHRQDFLDHGVIVAVEAAEFVAAERILRSIAQAFVAIGARALRQIEAAFILQQ